VEIRPFAYRDSEARPFVVLHGARLVPARPGEVPTHRADPEPENLAYTRQYEAMGR
jgi:hypothetical protein